MFLCLLTNLLVYCGSNFPSWLNRETGDEDQQPVSNAKRVKSETQTNSISEKFSWLDPPSGTSMDGAEINQGLIPDPPSSPDPAPPTPLNNRAVSPSGFLSARKRTPLKSQTGPGYEVKGISSKRLRMNTQNDTENPIPSVNPKISQNENEQNSAGSVAVNPSLSGFISARRRPVKTHPDSTEDQVLYMY